MALLVAGGDLDYEYVRWRDVVTACELENNIMRDGMEDGRSKFSKCDMNED